MSEAECLEIPEDYEPGGYCYRASKLEWTQEEHDRCRETYPALDCDGKP